MSKELLDSVFNVNILFFVRAESCHTGKRKAMASNNFQAKQISANYIFKNRKVILLNKQLTELQLTTYRNNLQKARKYCLVNNSSLFIKIENQMLMSMFSKH